MRVQVTGETRNFRTQETIYSVVVCVSDGELQELRPDLFPSRQLQRDVEQAAVDAVKAKLGVQPQPPGGAA